VTSRRPVAVIGVGNPMRGDDGVGPAAVARLAGADPPLEVDLVTLDGEPARLIEAWRHRRRAIVIDAACGGAAAGTIHRVEPDHDPPRWSAPPSSHGAGVAEALALARVMDALPEHLVVFGMEPGDLTLGEGLSDQVRAALPDLVAQVRAEATR